MFPDLVDEFCLDNSYTRAVMDHQIKMHGLKILRGKKSRSWTFPGRPWCYDRLMPMTSCNVSSGVQRVRDTAVFVFPDAEIGEPFPCMFLWSNSAFRFCDVSHSKSPRVGRVIIIFGSFRGCGFTPFSGGGWSVVRLFKWVGSGKIGLFWSIPIRFPRSSWRDTSKSAESRLWELNRRRNLAGPFVYLLSTFFLEWQCAYAPLQYVNQYSQQLLGTAHSLGHEGGRERES